LCVSQRNSYSYTSSQFRCSHCFKEFAFLKIEGNSEVYCPVCNNLSEEIADSANHPRDFEISESNSLRTDNIDSETHNNESYGSSSSYYPSNSTHIPSTTYNSFDNAIPEIIEEEPIAQSHIDHLNEAQNNSNQSSEHPRRIIIAAPPRRRIIDTGSRIIIQTESPIFILEGEGLDSLNGSIVHHLLTALGFITPFGIFSVSGGDIMDRLIEEFLRNDPNRHGPPPASEKAINELNEKKFGSSLGCKACIICQDDYVNEDIILDMPCNHDFHKDCLVSWLKLHNTCPVCRKDIEPETQPKDEQNAEQVNLDNFDMESEPANENN